MVWNPVRPRWEKGDKNCEDVSLSTSFEYSMASLMLCDDESRANSLSSSCQHGRSYNLKTLEAYRDDIKTTTLVRLRRRTRKRDLLPSHSI